VDANDTTAATQADAFAGALYDAGVREIFTLCGNHLLDAYRALVDRGITLIGVRSEGAAITAADGYARATKRLGVALVTGGPGHTNALTGLAGADAAGTPVLLLSGAPPAGRAGAGAHQELDQVTPMRSVCKWAAQVDRAEALVPLLRAAIAAATSMAAGPAHLSVPVNFFAGPAAAGQDEHRDGADGLAPVTGRANGPVMDTDWLRGRLDGAARPVAVVGAGAYFEDAEAAIAEFCRNNAIPVFTMDCARGAIPDDNELCFGYPDEPMNPVAAALGKADLVLLFGHRVDFRFGFGTVFDPSATIVEVSHDPRQLGVVDERTVSVPGPVGKVLVQLGGKPRRFAPWLATVQATVRADDDAGQIPDDATAPFDPGAVARVIRSAATTEVSVAMDAGDFVQWCRALFIPHGSGQWLRTGRMSTCGSGLPLALGGAVGRRAPVIAITGDGSLGYHVAELETIARLNLPVLCIVGTNQAWGLELNLQNSMFGPAYGEVSRLGDVDYAAIAAGFGVASSRVSSLSELAEQVDGFCRDPRPMLIDVPVTLEPSPLTKSIIANGGI
jgi:acetolactate synthase-1/2/3 large subunit